MYPYNNQPWMIQPLSKMKQTVTNILHNFNHKGVVTNKMRRNYEQTTIVKKIQVKKRKKVVAR